MKKTADGKNRFFAQHAKSSAALISLSIHAVLIVMALSFVVIKVIQKEETEFEAKPVDRPRMQLKKLQVPVEIKKKRVKQPRLRKRIVVQPKFNQTVPDIKMPEISGIKGGLGNGAGGLGAAAGIGFSMPEIELFGIKSQGEKVFIILDSSNEMMIDERGGIPAYTIIKEELLRIVDGLPPTVVFNVIVYNGGTYALFPDMVSANAENVAKVHEWLEPLNAVNPEDAGSTKYGTGTLGPGGSRVRDDFRTERIERQRKWYQPVALAMKQQADSIFLLACDWGNQWSVVSGRDTSNWDDRDQQRWERAVEESKRMLEEENRKRAERGQPPRVLSGGDRARVHAYLPGVKQPPGAEKDRYSPEDFTKALLETRRQYSSSEIPATSGINRNRRSRGDFSLNVIYFSTKDSTGVHGAFKKLAELCNGEYETVAGLEAIESYVAKREMEEELE